jgi:threonine/homoserine/homoserine lactone efflux protein
MILPFIVGALLSFIGAMPIAGPVSALVLKFGLKKQSVRGLLLATGAAIAEAIYALLAFFGFNALFNSVPFLEIGSRVLASTVLIGVGSYFFFSKSISKIDLTHEPDTSPVKGRKRKSFITGFMISIVNPTLIATWTAMITTLYGYHWFEYSTPHAIMFSFGVSLGIVSWFAVLLSLIHRHHHRFKQEWIRMILKGLGLLLVAIGLFTVISSFL